MNAPARDLDFVPRSDWTREEIAALFALPFPELMFRAQCAHRAHFDPARSADLHPAVDQDRRLPGGLRLLPARRRIYETGVKAAKLMDVEAVLADARAAKDAGASRFCMGAAWRSPKDKDLDAVCADGRRRQGAGHGNLRHPGHADRAAGARLKQAGLDYYNHNLDTSPEYYRQIITTRTYQDRLDTLEHVRDAGINVCCGGIVGMGESAADRVGMIHALATLPAHPESVPINALVQVEGTPAALAAAARSDRFRPHDRGGPHHHAEIDGAPVGRARRA